MEVVSSTRLLWAVLISAIAAVLILLTGEKNRNLRDFCSLLASVLKFLVVFSMIPTVLDASLAPAGKHLMTVAMQYAPYDLRGKSWDNLREPLADAVIEQVERRRQVLARHRAAVREELHERR